MTFFHVEKPTRNEGYIMAINRQHLHMLVNMIEESDFTTLYNVMIKFIPEDDPTLDEIEAIQNGREEYKKGEFVSLDSILAKGE